MIGVRLRPPDPNPNGAADVNCLARRVEGGGAFVPVDLVFPRERLAYLFADAGARMVIAATGLRGRVPAGLRIVHVDAAAELAGRGQTPVRA